MAQRLNHENAAALVELSILINLLAVRGGSTNHSAEAKAAGLDTDHDDFDADDGDSVSSEGSADTARLDELSEPHLTIRKRFLNRLAELFAAEQNGFFVTAAVFREVEREAHVDVWLARNNGFETPEDRRMVAATESALNQLAKEQDRGATDLWTEMLQYSARRLQFYRDRLTTVLDAHQMELKKITKTVSLSLADKDRQMWSYIYGDLFKSSRPSETNSERLERLVQLGAAVRHAVHSGSDLLTLFSGSSWARKIITTLCLVGKFKSAYGT